jgi:hypothetical protein
MDLTCANYINNEKLIISDVDVHEKLFKIPLQYLEEKGFVVSTEIDDIHIQILPNMRKGFLDRYRSLFCWCEKE